MKRKSDKFLNSLFKSPFFLELSPIFAIVFLKVITSIGIIIRIELYRRILQALFSADGNALGMAGGTSLLGGLILAAIYEAVYSGIVYCHDSAYAKAEGNIYRQLLHEILVKNGKLRSLDNCPMSAGDRFSMASEDCANYASAIVSKASLFADFVTVPCYILYGCSINLAITAALTGITFFLSRINRKNKKKLYDSNQEYNESFHYWSNFLWKAVDNLEVIKVFLDKERIRKEQHRRGEALDGVRQRRLKTWLDMTLIEESSDMVFTLLILCAAFTAVALKRILASDILAMAESLNTVQRAIFALPEKIVQLNELESMASRISRFESLGEEPGDVAEITDMEQFVLKQVSFSYGEKKVLNGVDFAFEKGKFYILAGASGCGKSTLLKVMAKMVPYSGSVCWNRVELKSISRQALYKRLSWQAQNQMFLEGSIRENICLGRADEGSIKENIRPGTQTEEVKRYADILKSFFIQEILDKNGFDDAQILSFRGAPLSSGECQMVSMAGILYAPKDVILLDEVFSAVDPAKEQVYFRELASLARAGKLVILVSHRLTNLDEADEILFMEDGRIRENGSCQALVSAGGRFCEWHKLHQERSDI